MRIRSFHGVGLAALLALQGAPAFAIPDDAPKVAATASGDAEMQARLAYNFGIEIVDQARADETAAEKLKGAKQKDALAAAQSRYIQARVKFEEAAKANPQMPEAWNMIGFTSRHLGEHEKALAAYDKAIGMRDKYVEAIEYRAEAYLGLARIEDAKNAYLFLYTEARPVADTLMQSMERWVALKKKQPGNVPADELNSFALWVAARGQIAQQTASLAPGQSMPRWH